MTCNYGDRTEPWHKSTPLNLKRVRHPTTYFCFHSIIQPYHGLYQTLINSFLNTLLIVFVFGSEALAPNFRKKCLNACYCTSSPPLAHDTSSPSSRITYTDSFFLPYFSCNFSPQTECQSCPCLNPHCITFTVTTRNRLLDRCMLFLRQEVFQLPFAEKKNVSPLVFFSGFIWMQTGVRGSLHVLEIILLRFRCIVCALYLQLDSIRMSMLDFFTKFIIPELIVLFMKQFVYWSWFGVLAGKPFIYFFL